MKRIRTIDSHTGGEPTRVVIEGGPNLGQGTFRERWQRLTTEFDWFRSSVVNEPRGSEVLVGALLCEPDDNSCAAGVMFFNNRGFLGMCGHGTIGLIVSLHYDGRIGPGSHRIETPVGIVVAELKDDGQVAVENVPSYRCEKGVMVETRGLGAISGDIAYGGNWFYLVQQNMGTLKLSRAAELTEKAWQIRRALASNAITGADGAEIDHIEFFAAPHDPANHSRNFVLCPGGAFDRSPCGTGASAKLACLAADGQLAPGDIWRQESVIGSIFACSYTPAVAPNQIVPTIRGTAYVTGETTLLFDPNDPFRTGIR